MRVLCGALCYGYCGEIVVIIVWYGQRYCVVLHGAQATERGATPPEVSSGQVPLPASLQPLRSFLENYRLQRMVMAG